MSHGTTTDDELSCREVVELVTDYLEIRLPAAGRRRFEEHLAGCDGCTTYVEQLRATVRLLGRVGDDALDATLRDRLVEAFRGSRAR